jgi:hypothetical protein
MAFFSLLDLPIKFLLRNTMSALLSSNLPLPLLHRGKVRDVYAISDTELLIVATDRLSAFDVVLPDPIPGKPLPESFAVSAIAGRC